MARDLFQPDLFHRLREWPGNVREPRAVDRTCRCACQVQSHRPRRSAVTGAWTVWGSARARAGGQRFDACMRQPLCGARLRTMRAQQAAGEPPVEDQLSHARGVSAVRQRPLAPAGKRVPARTNRSQSRCRSSSVACARTRSVTVDRHSKPTLNPDSCERRWGSLRAKRLGGQPSPACMSEDWWTAGGSNP